VIRAAVRYADEGWIQRAEHKVAKVPSMGPALGLFGARQRLRVLGSLALRSLGTTMEYAAIGLGMLGFAVGGISRLSVLLPVVMLLLLISIIFSVSCGFDFFEIALTVMTAQAIVQSSYFLGLLARTIFSAHRVRHIL
jgi:hypothetical protein